jgi:hypothetical protein
MQALSGAAARLFAEGGMMMMDPFERAARALARLEGHSETAEREGAPVWQEYLPTVRAVLEALYEPNPAMREGGGEILRAAYPDRSAMAAEDDAANIWRMMIDTLGKEA